MRRLSATIVSLLLAAPVLAAPGGPGFGAGRGLRHGGPGALFERRAERIADLLELDAAQRAAFEQLRTDSKASVQPRLAEMRALAEELHALLDSGSTDAQEVGEKAIALHRLRGELRAERQAAEAEFVKLLSPEQRFAFEALEESRPLRRDRRGGRHGLGWGLGAPEPELD